MKPFDMVLIKPIMTEKMLGLQEDARKYAFEVARTANKIEIKHAIQSKFNVVVSDVHTVNVKGKSKRMNSQKGLTRGRRSDWKKAVVTLDEGFSIDLFGEKQ